MTYNVFGGTFNLAQLNAVIMAQIHWESSPGSFDECRLSTGWLPTLRPGQLTWAAITGSYHPHPHCHLSLLHSPKADTHFTVPQRVENSVGLDTAGRV